jgi:large subunit ribosomal protein L21
MYAVVTTGGKQYRVEAGTELVIERLVEEAGASVTFDRVLLIGDGDAVTIGSPTVAGATVSGTVLAEELGPKLIIFKFKQKATYRRTRGHRQHLTRVRIDEISTGEKKSRKAEAPAEPEAKASATTDAPAKPATTRKAAAKPKAEPKARADKADKSDKADKAEADAPAKPATRRKTTTGKASKAKAEAEE